MTSVVNLHRDPYDVYVGRGSIYGNPYTTKGSSFLQAVRVESVSQAVFCFYLWLTTDAEVRGWAKPTRDQINLLRDKRLGCYCETSAAGQLRCHGLILAALADGRDPYTS